MAVPQQFIPAGELEPGVVCDECSGDTASQQAFTRCNIDGWLQCSLECQVGHREGMHSDGN